MMQQTPLSGVAPAAPLRLSHVGRHDPRRASVEAFVRRRYWQVHRARRCHFLEHLLIVDAAPLGARAAIGLERAGARSLFLERYLDAPVEELLAAFDGRAVSRDRIVEIGTLASLDPQVGTLLMILTVAWLAGYGADWGVFTATRAVRERLCGIGVPLHALGAADPARLGALAAEWGRYYEEVPHVVAASFREARRLIRDLPAEWAELGVSAFDDGQRHRASEAQGGPRLRASEVRA